MHYRSTLLGIFSVAVFIQNVNAGLWGRSAANSEPEPEPPRRRKNLTCVLFFGNGACAFKCRLFGQGAEGYCDNLLCTCKYNDVIYVEGDNGFEPVPNSLAGRNTFIEPGRETPAPYEDEDADDLTPEENELKIKLITMMTFSPKHGSELCQFLRENNIDIDDVKKLSEKERKLNGGISFQPVTSRSLQSGTDILTQGNSIATRVLQSLPESCERPLRGGHFPAPRKSNRSNGGTPPRKNLKHHPRRRIEDDDEADDDADDQLSSNLRSKHLPTHHDPHGNSHSPNRRQFTLNADTMRTPSLRVTTPKHKNVKNKSPPKIRKVPERPGRFSFTHPLKRSTDLQLNHVNPQKPELKDSPITPLPKYTVQPAVAEILPAAPSKDPVAGNLKTVAPSESTTPNPQVTSRGKEEDAAPKIAKPMPMRRRRRKRRVTPSVPTPSKLPLKEQDPDKKSSEKSNAEEVLKPQPQEEGAPQTSPEQNSDKSPEIVNPEELPTSKIGIENQSASDSPEKPDVKTNETQERKDDRPNQLYVDNLSAPENPVPKPEATEPVLRSVTPIRNRLEQNPQKPLTVQMKPPSNHQTMELFDENVTPPKPEATEPVLKSVTPMRNRLEQNPQKPLTVQMKLPSNHQTIELFDSNNPEVDSDPSNEMMPQDAANNQTTINPPDTQPVVPSSWAWPWPWFKEPPVKTSEDLSETSPSSDVEPQSQEKNPDPVPEKDSERSDEKKPNQEEISQALIGSPNTEDNLGDQKQQEPPKKEANDERLPVEEETEGKPLSQQEETYATPRESPLVSEHQPESNHEVVDTPVEKKASDSDFQSATPNESSLAHNSQEPSSSSSEPKEQNPEEVGDVPSHPRENSLKSPENFNIEDSRNDGKLPLENEDSTNQQPPEDLDTKDSHIKEKQGQSPEKDQNNPETLPEKLEEEASPKPIASSETPYEAPLSSNNQPLFHEKDTPSLREEDTIASRNKTSTPNDSDLGTTNEKPRQTTPERINGSPMEALDKQSEDFVDSQSPKNPDAKASLVDEQKEPSRKEVVDLNQMKEATGSDDSSDLISPGQPQKNSQSNDGSPLKESNATDENKQDSESPQPPESPNTAISSDEPIKKELDKEDVAQNIEPESHSSGPDTPLESSLSPGIQNIPKDKDSQPRKEPVKLDTLSSTPDEPKASNDLKESLQPSTEPSVVPPAKDTDTTKDNQDSILPQSPTNDDTVTNPNAEEGHENPSGDIPANKEIPSKKEPEVQSSSGLPPVSALPIESSSSSPNIVSHPEEQTRESQKLVEESTDLINPKANSESKGDTSEIPESQPKMKSEENPRKDSEAATKPSEAQKEKDTGTENKSQPSPSEDGDIAEPEEEKVLEEYEDNDSDNPKTQELRDTGTNKLQSPPSKDEGSNITQPDEEKVLEEFEDDDSEHPNDPAQTSKQAAKPNAEKIEDSMNNPLKKPITNEDNSANDDSKPTETPKTPTQGEEEERNSKPDDAEIKREMKPEASDESSRPVELPASSDEPLSSLNMPPQPEEEKIDTEPKGDMNSDTRSGSEQDGSETPEPQRRKDSDEGAEKDSDAIPEPPLTREVEGTGTEDESQPAPSENGGPNISEPEEEHIEEEQVLEQFEDSEPENPDALAQPLKEEETPITENDSSIGESSRQSAPNGESTADQDSSPKEAPKTQVQDEASSTNPTDAKIDEEPKVHEPVLSEKKAEAVHNEEDAVDPEHPQIEKEQEVLEYEDDSESDANAHPLTATKSLGPLNEEIIQPKEVENQQKPDAEEQPEEIEHEEVIEDFVEDGSDHPSPADVGSNAGESDDKIKDQGIPKEADEENKVGEPIESMNNPEESAFNNPQESSIPETAEEDPKEEASIPKQESPTVENASPASNNSMEILDEFVHETFINDENENLEQDKDGKLNELSDESLPQNNAVTPENQTEETKMLNAPNREDDENKIEGPSMNNDKEVSDDNEKEEILHEFDDEEEVDDAEPHEEKGSSSPELTPEAPRNSSKKENTPQSQETSDASHSPASTKSDPMGDTTQPENPEKEVDNKSASNSDEETVLDEYTEQDQEVPTEDSEDVFSGLTGLAVLREYVLKSLNK